VEGCFYVIDTASGINPTGLNLVCEGFASAATCFEAMDVPTVVAFDGDNLLPVAKALHAAYPKARFILCGDDAVDGSLPRHRCAKGCLIGHG